MIDFKGMSSDERKALVTQLLVLGQSLLGVAKAILEVDSEMTQPQPTEVPLKRKETPQTFKPKRVEGWYD